MNKERWILRLRRSESFLFSAVHSCRLILISFLLSSVCSISSLAQVYNYSPISYKDFETNPAYLATDEMNNNIEISHQNSFNSTDAFSSIQLKYSAYLPSSFVGFGVSLNTTQIANNVRVQNAGFGFAYRNVLFNKLYFKLGAMYKLIGTNREPGIYDYYSFTPSNSDLETRFSHNINTSLTINSDQDRFFVSVGLLNIPLPTNSNAGRIEFPSYYTLHLGNLMSFFGRARGSEVSYSGFVKTIDSTVTFNHYTTVKFQYKLGRKSRLVYGSKVGFAENSYFHIIPTIGYLREKIKVILSYNFHLDKSTFQPAYFESLKLRLTLVL